MRLTSVSIQNFRAVKDATLVCDDLTALVGANGSGKSTFLRAIQMLQTRQSKISEEDYHKRNTDEDIVIMAVFTDLPESAVRVFSEYVYDGKLIVELVIKWSDGKPTPIFYGHTIQNPDFIDIFTERAERAKELYNDLRNNKDYDDFPNLTTHQKIKDYLRDWEKKNPKKCKWLRNKEQRHEFRVLIETNLAKFIQFLYIPAVRDAAADASELKGSAMNQLMEIVTKRILLQNEQINKFHESVKKEHASVMDPSKLKDLDELTNDMNQALHELVPDAQVTLEWDLAELEINFPEAHVNLVEDGYRTTVGKAGHGLQRAFIMTLLRLLTIAQARDSESTVRDDKLPTIVLMIEEPELYQHPIRQRHFADVLLSLASSTTAPAMTQIIYSTHSPHFVGLDRINQIRLLRKIRGADGKPETTKIYSTSLEDVAQELSDMRGHGSITSEMLRSRLKRVMTPWMNEGFFSDIVVLVEGDFDRAAVLTVAKMANYLFDSMGISVIPCLGKENIVKPTMIFKNLGIPIYLIWDSDSNKKPGPTEDDFLLFSLVKGVDRDWPTKTAEKFACLEKNMNETIKQDIGKNYATYENKSLNILSLKKNRDKNNPDLISLIIENAYLDDVKCKTLEGIVEQIVKLYEHR